VTFGLPWKRFGSDTYLHRPSNLCCFVLVALKRWRVGTPPVWYMAKDANLPAPCQGKATARFDGNGMAFKISLVRKATR